METEPDDDTYQLVPPDEEDDTGIVDNRLETCEAEHSTTYRVCLSDIQDFVETTIVLRKERNELGISIAGGSDTYLEQVCVTEVHKDGAADQDGRLRKGDVILAVNDLSLREVNSVDAVRVLREAASPLRLIVLRENPLTLFTTNERPTKFITVELRKSSIKDRLGVSIMQRVNGRGVFITYVCPHILKIYSETSERHCTLSLRENARVERPPLEKTNRKKQEHGSIASKQGRIMQGDQILEINGQNVRDSNQKDICHMLKEMDGAIVLLLGRIPSLSLTIQEWARRKAQQSLRTRTSTWSSYTGNNKEKLQAQRPSLPVSKEGCTLLFPSIVALVCSPCQDSIGDISRNSSIHRSRLSIVAEDAKIPNDTDEEDGLEIDEFTSSSCENPLLPSIKVTSF